MTTPTPLRRILVPLDGSDPSLTVVPWLRALADANTHVTLLRVVPAPLPMIEIAGATTIPYEDIRERHLDAATAWLEAVAEGLVDITKNITRLARLSHPADEILDVAEEREVDLIMMATHGRGAAGRLMLGSVADRIARASSVPVMLVPTDLAADLPTATTTAEPNRIVVPLDGSDRARSALPVAASIGIAHRWPVHLVRAVPSRDALFASRDARNTGQVYQRLVFATPVTPISDREKAYYEGYCASMRDALHAEASRLQAQGLVVTSDLLVGPTVPTLLDELRRGDIVVMTSHGEGGVRRWMIGSVAEKVITSATAPVVLVPNQERRKLIDQ